MATFSSCLDRVSPDLDCVHNGEALYSRLTKIGCWRNPAPWIEFTKVKEGAVQPGTEAAVHIQRGRSDRGENDHPLISTFSESHIQL